MRLVKDGDPKKIHLILTFILNRGNGIHDIHMNQGNVEKWKGDNGIWQDGGILIHFEKEEEWIGIFLAFQSQSWCTDDEDMLAFPLSIVIIRVIIEERRAFTTNALLLFYKTQN